MALHIMERRAAVRLAPHGVVESPSIFTIVGSLVLSLTGLGIAVYLTIAHFVGSQVLACSDSGVVNCAKVTTSAQSYFLHVPVAILGLGFYVVVVAFNLPMAWRSLDPRVHIARLALMALGVGFALYLVSAELLIIRNICLWCTGVHIATFLLFILVVTSVPKMLGWGAGRELEAGSY